MSEKRYPAAMHSLEHILNGTISSMLGSGRAFSAHIESKKSKCDYRFDRNLTAEEIEQITARVNEVIEQDLPITRTEMDRACAENLYNLERLPDDAPATLTIVHIGDYDHCPCIGEHVGRTSEIGGRLRIISSDCNEGVLRVRFKIDKQA